MRDDNGNPVLSVSDTERGEWERGDWVRAPEHDKRIRHGDDYTGDAWRNLATGALHWTVVVGRAVRSNWDRAPEHDKRIRHGDDYAGDAWINPTTGAVRWVTVGHIPG